MINNLNLVSTATDVIVLIACIALFIFLLFGLSFMVIGKSYYGKKYSPTTCVIALIVNALFLTAIICITKPIVDIMNDMLISEFMDVITEEIGSKGVSFSIIWNSEYNGFEKCCASLVYFISRIPFIPEYVIGGKIWINVCVGFLLICLYHPIVTKIWGLNDEYSKENDREYDRVQEANENKERKYERKVTVYWDGKIKEKVTDVTKYESYTSVGVGRTFCLLFLMLFIPYLTLTVLCLECVICFIAACRKSNNE